MRLLYKNNKIGCWGELWQTPILKENTSVPIREQLAKQTFIYKNFKRWKIWTMERILTLTRRAFGARAQPVKKQAHSRRQIYFGRAVPISTRKEWRIEGETKVTLMKDRTMLARTKGQQWKTLGKLFLPSKSNTQEEDRPCVLLIYPSKWWTI